MGCKINVFTCFILATLLRFLTFLKRFFNVFIMKSVIKNIQPETILSDIMLVCYFVYANMYCLCSWS